MSLSIIRSAYPTDKHNKRRSIFLAGPTYRDPIKGAKKSWRNEASSIFAQLQFDGHLFIPEPFGGDYRYQIAWEEHHLEMATVILFWVPRNMEELPALTTNIEFGEWMKSGKIVLGYPKGAPHLDYMHYKANKYEVPVCHELRSAVSEAINLCNIVERENS